MVVEERVAMDQLNRRKQEEGVALEDSPEKGKCESPPLRKLQHQDDLDEDCNNSGSPKVVERNRKASVVGAQIGDEDEELFLRRQSALSSKFSERTQHSPGNKRTGIDPGSVGSPRNLSRLFHSSSPTSKRIPSDDGTSSGGSGSYSGVLSSSESIDQTVARKVPSGNLYPCAGNPTSTQLNVAHFTFENAPTLPPESNNLTERIFKKLMGQSRLHKSSDDSKSPVSTLDAPKSPSPLKSKSKRKSLRSRVEDANTVVAANPRSKSQLAQYLRSITAANLAADDDHLEGPSEVAWLEPESPYPSDRSFASSPKKHDSWSSNNSSWSLSLNPLRTVSTIVSRRQLLTPSRRKLSRLGEPRGDAITRISLTGSYDGSYSARSRCAAVRKGSEPSSGRSWWSDLGSGRKSSSIWGCSGRLLMDSSAEPDLHEPDLAQAQVVRPRQVEGARARESRESSLAISKPTVAATFVFRGTTSGSSTPDAPSSSQVSRATTDLHKSAAAAAAGMMDSESEFDIYLEEASASVSDSEDTSQWGSVRKRSLDYVKEVAGASTGLSSRALSRLLLMERTPPTARDARFNVDLQLHRKLEKPFIPRSPDFRLRIFAAEDKASPKRSILSPCLPNCLQRSPQDANKPSSIQQVSAAAAAVAPSKRRLQVMNSFTSRLGYGTDPPTLSGPIYVQ